MKKLITLILFLGLYLTSNAQIIRFVDYKYQSDVKIFFVKHKYQADGIVYMTPYKFQARNMMCFWYDSKLSYGGIKVYVVKFKYEADVLIYVSKLKYQAEYNKKYLEYFNK